jgi:hypothetical protein
MGENGLVLQLGYTGTVPTPFPEAQHELPPLILHPIAGDPDVLQEDFAGDEESRRMEIRRLELKMLCCLGKDLNRWLEQCLEFAATEPSLAELCETHLIDLLVVNPPESLVRKMSIWGVGEFRAIFARALGLAAVFSEPPAREHITDTFVRDMSVYADVLYRSRRQALTVGLSRPRCRFDVYASGEYASMLERSWAL